MKKAITVTIDEDILAELKKHCINDMGISSLINSISKDFVAQSATAEGKPKCLKDEYADITREHLKLYRRTVKLYNDYIKHLDIELKETNEEETEEE